MATTLPAIWKLLMVWGIQSRSQMRPHSWMIVPNGASHLTRPSSSPSASTKAVLRCELDLGAGAVVVEATEAVVVLFVQVEDGGGRLVLRPVPTADAAADCRILVDVEHAADVWLVGGVAHEGKVPASHQHLFPFPTVVLPLEVDLLSRRTVSWTQRTKPI